MRLSSILIAGIVVVTVYAQDAPLPPSEAAARMSLPEGFRATLFAGEPDVVQPIAFTIDHRGRLWVVECLSYPNWIRDGKPGKDRVLIFEDTDGDGRFDRRTVFLDKLANVSGIQVGFGGVWLCAVPNVLFIPDRNGDDVPDGPPQVLLDGWSLDAKHNVFSALAWGPDGWLYGCNGIIATSKVGKPGTPDDQRVPMNCGVWRYHPTRPNFEVVAHGTTNPWGLDWDDHGQMFITNCVIPHLWHVVPGAHFQRMYGQDLNPHAYRLMETCADHLHWAGGHWTSSRGGKGNHGEAGGGHAHAGGMIYLGDNWPDRYRNGVFMCNIHGSRVNHDILERRGSGYVARHGKDFLLANDPWFRGLTLQYGPDGAGYVSDWCDSGECHDYDKVHVSGRIYKITYGHVKHSPVDLGKFSDAQLVQLQLHRNDWYVRHARRLLQERTIAGKLSPEVPGELWKIVNDHPDVTRRLRALWALHCCRGISQSQFLALLKENAPEHVRAWTIPLGLETFGENPAAKLPSRSQFLDRMTDLAVKDPSPVVRLALASALQRLPLEDRWAIAEGLLGHAEDAEDPNLPLMIWYGIEPLVPASPGRSARLVTHARIPLVRELVARRLAAMPDRANDPVPGVKHVVELLRQSDDPILHRDILRGIEEALRGRRQVPMPKEWPAIYPRLAESPLAEVQEKGTALAVQFGDPQAAVTLRKMVLDSNAAAARRTNALQTLIFQQNPELVPLLHGRLTDPVLRGPAIRGLAGFADPQTPALILKHYPTLADEEKSDAVATLASRPAYALALLDAVEKKHVPRNDLSAFTVRQMLGLKSKEVADRLNQVWGPVRPASAEKTALLAKYKTMLTPEFLKRADRSNGRSLFAKNCAACHRLFDDGGSIGPELTGAQRSNLDYLLENMIDPNAIVAGDYLVTLVATKSGRVLTGIIKQESDRALIVQMQNEAVIIPKDEIETREKLPISLMPEGMLDKLTFEEVRDLVAYLASPNQVPPRKR